MPVTKFRSIEDVPTLGAVAEGQLPERMRALWARTFMFARPLDFRGVNRYSSIEQAFEARSRATVERMRETRK
jgi:hypothetical protein